MIRFLFDENFNNDIVRGLFRRNAKLNALRVQDAGLRGANDPQVLHWAAENNRVLITHDVSTVTAFAYSRMKAGLDMPGVIQCPRKVPISVAIDDLLLIAECSDEKDLAGKVLYLPLS